MTSDLPGASIRVTTRRCSYSLAELVAGVDIAYEVRVEQALQGVKPHTRGDEVQKDWPSWVNTFALGCIEPKDASNLVVANWVTSPSGRGPVSCPDCDLGRCRPRNTPAVDVAPGTYKHTWRKWTGQEFVGESDTGRLPGDPFPPGEYRLVLRADGNFVPSEGAAPKLFHMETTRRITISP